MSDKTGTNVAIIILLVFLFISGCKSLFTSAILTNSSSSGISGLQDFESLRDFSSFSSKKKKNENTVVLRDFSEIQNPKNRKRSIDKATASKYTKTRPLSGTEIIELTKLSKLGKYMNVNKKVVIYVNSGSDRDVQAFVSEFAKVRSQYANNPNYVFIPLSSIWDLNDMSAKNSHDRVINNFKKDCGLVCIIDTGSKKMIRMKGYDVNKKSAQIMGVMLK